MTRLLLVGLVAAACNGTAVDEPVHDPNPVNPHPVLMPPSAVVEDCTTGCDTPILLNTSSDVSYLTAADTTLKFDLAPNVCVRLSSPPDSNSVYLSDGSNWRMSGCQVVDNKNVYDKPWGLTALPPGVPSWLRVETNTFDASAYCSLSCTEVKP